MPWHEMSTFQCCKEGYFGSALLDCKISRHFLQATILHMKGKIANLRMIVFVFAICVDLRHPGADIVTLAMDGQQTSAFRPAMLGDKGVRDGDLYLETGQWRR